MKLQGIFQYLLSYHTPPQQQGSVDCLIFNGNTKNLIKNGEILLKERFSLFDGRTNPIHCFSADDLNSMNVIKDRIGVGSFLHNSFAGVWDGKPVLVKIFCDDDIDSSKFACREIAVATQMGTHRHVHRLLGCCLHTNYPTLVYEWANNGTLHDRLVNYKEQSKKPLEFKERLRIGWEIAHAVAYLHTAFRRPIIHRNLKPLNVLLDQNDSAMLSDFSISVWIPEGKKHVQEELMGTWGYVAPEYLSSGRVAQSSDVFAFGTLLLVLLTGKPVLSPYKPDHGWDRVVDWVIECYTANCLDDVVDPAISVNGTVAADEHLCHLKALVGLALRCSAAEEEHRPTMVDVAAQLQNMIIS